MTNSGTYIRHLHAFRGFAILNVVGAHAWSFMIFWTGMLSSEGIKWLFWLTETIFHGSTLYFAIISGLLFTKVLKSKSWQAFYKSKFINVVLPYILLSFALTGFYWQYMIQRPDVENTLGDYIRIVLSNIINGKADIHFWYIPVLIVMFLITPAIKWVNKHSNILAWLIILSPLIISRSPFPDFLQPQSFVYFIGAYALGMMIGDNYTKFREYIAQYQLFLIVVVVVTSCTLFMLYLNDYKSDGFYSLRQTLVYIQKVSICSLVLYWFSLAEAKLPQWLSTLGTYAFAIFFLHVVFIGFMIGYTRSILEVSRTTELIALFGSLNFIAGILGSILLASIIKWGLGRHARKLVGA